MNPDTTQLDPIPAGLDLLVVIVCYKAVDLTLDCLASLVPQLRALDRAAAAVCENGTGGSAMEQLRSAVDRQGWGDVVCLTQVNPNRGFAGGNNAVLEQALSLRPAPRLVLLLNADTVVRPGALAQLLHAAARHPRAGVIGPRLEWPDATPQISCFRYLNPVAEFLAAARTGPLTRVLRPFDVPLPVTQKPQRCQWTSFACALIRREVFEQVGVLDAGYYLYFDDVDFCRRARGAGWEVLHWPEARVVHLRGRSNPVKEMTLNRRRRPEYFYASRARYFAKFYGVGGLWLTNLLWTAGRGVALLRETVGHKQPHTCQSEVRDIWTHWRSPMRLRNYQQDPRP